MSGMSQHGKYYIPPLDTKSQIFIIIVGGDGGGGGVFIVITIPHMMMGFIKQEQSII